MALKPFNIPKAIRLPGWVIKVKLVPPDKLEDAHADFNYTEAGGIIRISNAISLEMQRFFLAHELDHAVNDYQRLLLRDGVATVHDVI